MGLSKTGKEKTYMLNYHNLYSDVSPTRGQKLVVHIQAIHMYLSTTYIFLLLTTTLHLTTKQLLTIDEKCFNIPFITWSNMKTKICSVEILSDFKAWVIITYKIITRMELLIIIIICHKPSQIA